MSQSLFETKLEAKLRWENLRKKNKEKGEDVSLASMQEVVLNRLLRQGHIFVCTSYLNSWKGYSKNRTKLLKHPKEKDDKKEGKRSNLSLKPNQRRNQVGKILPHKLFIVW